MRDVHVIYTDYAEHGWGISSPQVPNLVAGTRTIEEALEQTEGILELGGLEPGSYELHRHEEKYVVAPQGDEFLLRFGEERDEDDARRPATGRMLYSVEHGEHLDDLLRMPVSPTGEHLVITVVADDSLGWIMDQLAPSQGAYLQFYAGDDALYGVPFYDDDLRGRGKSLEELGLSRASTIAQMLDVIAAAEVDDLRIAVEHVHEVAPSA